MSAMNAYVGAWFLYDGPVFEIVMINGNSVIFKDPDDDIICSPLELPLPLVSDLINSFGYKNNVVVDKSTIFYFTSI
jgi:hypothetical protein